MKNILYSRRLTEKINPAFFRDKFSVLVVSTSSNIMGENVKSYNEGPVNRALIAHRDATRDDFNEDNTAVSNLNVITIITWRKISGILNPENMIRWYRQDGTTQDMRIDASYEEYGIYVRLRCIYDK